MKDKTSDFDSCYINENTKTPYCKKHGALICVKKDIDETVWRCIQKRNLITGKCDNDCLSACVMLKTRNEYYA